MARRYRRKSPESSLVSLVFLLVGYMYFVKKVSMGMMLSVGAIVSFAGIMIAWQISESKKRKLLASGIDLIDQMAGEEFEKFLLAHYQKKGYSGNLTPASNDYGADLILEKDGHRVVVQAKRWRHKVGIEAIQQVIGSKAHYGAAGAWVITNSYFTPQAVKLAESNHVELWDRDKLFEYLKINHCRDEIQGFQTSNDCPLCGKNLVERKGSNGPFMGCGGYPKCRYTRDA